MRKVYRLTVAIVGVWGSGCTQVHQLGLIDESADGADSESTDSGDGASSVTTEESEEASTETEGTSEDDTSETTDTGDEETTGSDEETTEDTDTDTDTTESESGGTGGPIPDPCQVVDLGGDPGIDLQIELMNQWNDGACHNLFLTNNSGDDVIWFRDLRFGGTLDNVWNAEGEELSASDWRFGGQASADNIVVLVDETVQFGTCMLCTPPEDPP